MKMLVGGILLAAGILIAGASGLCSLAVLFGTGEMTGTGMWSAVLVFGGVPFALGALLAFGGWSTIRSARRERDKRVDDVADVFE